MPHLSILLLRHNGTGITHFPLRPALLITAVLLTSGLFLFLGGMVIWQSVQSVSYTHLTLPTTLQV